MSSLNQNWYQCALAGMDKRQAAQIMRCHPATAEKRLRQAESDIRSGAVAAESLVQDPALSTVSLYLQSNWPTRVPRPRPRLVDALAMRA